MKISDLLRQAADQLDQEEEEDLDIPFGDEEKDEYECPCHDEIPTVYDDGATAMMSPLQQKHELLKKVSDVPNNADKIAPYEKEKEEEKNPLNLELLKQLAGINTESADDPGVAVAATYLIADDSDTE